MENASKALIIAGAILLAIVIISLGLIVVNNSRSTIDTSNLSEQEIQTFNSNFAAYEGSSVTGTRVKTLIQAVIASNANTANTNKQITLKLDGSTETDPAKISSTINTGSKYSVTLSYTNGLVSTITIK